MTVVLRSQKSSALTFEEMDGNFTDINSRTTILESNYIKTLNGQTATASSITLNTDNIAESASATNIWYTDARARASISITDAGGDGSLSYNSTSGVLTYTGPNASEVRAHVSATTATGVTYTSGTGIIALASIPNSSITNSTITFAGDATTDAVSLGETITFTGGEGIDTSVSANVLTIAAEDATTSNKGIASFSTDHFAVSSGAVTIKADGIDDTHIDFGTGANQVSTADLPEQTNLYYTDARVLTKLNATSVDALSDVDTVTAAPVNNYVLTWDSSVSNWIPAAAPGAAGGEANTVSNLGSGSEIFSNKSGIDIRLRSLTAGSNIALTQNVNDISIAASLTPTFTSVTTDGIKIDDNNITSTRTNDNLVLLPSGSGIVDVRSNLSSSGTITATSFAGTITTAAQTNITSLGAQAADLTIGSGNDLVMNTSSNAHTITTTTASSARTHTLPDVSGTIITTGNLSSITEVGTIPGTLNVGSLASLDGGIDVDGAFTVANTSGNVATSGTLTVTNSITGNSLVVDGITINDNNITTNISNANLVLDTSGTGVIEIRSSISVLASQTIDFNANRLQDVADPSSAQDAATKAYVDSATSSASALAIAGGFGTDTVTVGSDTLTFAGTSNEIETTVTNNQVQIGLPNSITLSDSLTVSHDVTIGGDLTVAGMTSTIGAANLSIADQYIYLNTGDTIDDAGTVFTGSGLDDGTLEGSFEGITSTTYYVRIDATGTPDTFEWSKDNFSTTEATGVNITDSHQSLDNNISINFIATTGHTIGDKWVGSAVPISIDTGIWSNQNTGAIGAGYSHVGVFFDVTDTTWKFVNEYDPEPEGAIDTSHASFAYSPVEAKSFKTGSLTIGDGNKIISNDSNANIELAPNGSGIIDVQSAITVSGTITGNVTGNLTGTASVATTVVASANNSTNETTYITFVDGATGSQGIETDTGLSYNPSTGTLTSTIFSGTATEARYADLAEKYISDAEYPAGTVMTVGGGAEITFCDKVNIVAGVISTNPAYLMNSALATGVPVALVGRVPVRVVGSVVKGQMVYADSNGVASATAEGEKVGIALETSEETGEKLIECMLKV